jgi:hypothetical protein
MGDLMTHNWSFKCFQDFLFLPTKWETLNLKNEQ